MRYGVEQLITVKAYAESIRYDETTDSTMIRVEDYVKSLREDAIEAQKSSLITVQEYVQSIRENNSLENSIIEEVETKVSEKAEKEAQYLEEKLA